MDEIRPGYYAVIPADVRYDDQIPPNAKLLYGEISALIGKDGFCYASNAYFMKLFGFSDPTISRLITQLEKAGYIQREIEKDDSGQVKRRKIYLSVSVPELQPPIKNDTTLPSKLIGGGIKNDGETNISLPITPLSPPEGGGNPRGQKSSRRGSKSNADVLPERFNGFWLFYRTHIPDGVNAGNRQKAIRAWDKLAPSDELATKMAQSLAKQVKSQVWLSGIGVPHASTWLNNRGWEDDWGAAGQSSQPALQQNGEEVEWVC